MTIYLDVLIVLNIYVNYLLLKGTEKFLRFPVKKSRIIWGSVIGSLSCLIFLLPDCPAVLSLVLKLLCAMGIVLIAFGFGEKRRFIRCVLIFFCINFLFAGMITAVEFLFRPQIMAVRNGVLYLDFSLLTLIGATIAAYVVLSCFHWILSRKSISGSVFRVTVEYHGKTAVFEALADTGNQLVDYFSGKPVILCRKEQLKDLIRLGEYSPENIPKGFRILPMSTANEESLAYIFKPDRVFLKEKEKPTREISAMVGFLAESRMQEEAILNPNLL